MKSSRITFNVLGGFLWAAFVNAAVPDLGLIRGLACSALGLEAIHTIVYAYQLSPNRGHIIEDDSAR